MPPKREGRWICPYCGDENLGRFEHCEAGCGAGRPEGVRFYLPKDSPIIYDPQILADAESGADWNCDHCGSANKGAKDGHPIIACVHCGEARTAEDTVNPVRHFAAHETPRSAADVAPVRPERRASSSRHETRTPTAARQGGSALGIIGAIAAALLLITLVASFFVPLRQDSGEIASLTWSQSVRIEKLVTEHRDGWSLPSEARKTFSERRIRTYVEVVDHYVPDTRPATKTIKVGEEPYKCGVIDLGNGYFEDKECTRDITKTVTYDEPYDRPVMRKDPVWDTWYQYDIDVWVHSRSPATTGHGQNLAWPDVHLAANEREARRSGQYVAVLRFKDSKPRTQQLTLKNYKVLEVGDLVSSSFTVWGSPLGLRIGRLSSEDL